MKKSAPFKVEYDKIKELIEAGHTVESACKKLKHSRSYFYNNASEAQKYEIKSLSLINSTRPNTCFNDNIFDDDNEI